MKKFLIALALGTLLVLALATTVTADNGPHGGFNGSTDACASCHRIHSAKGDTNLLVEGTIWALCTSCHDGTGAFTNVVDGYYDTTIPATDSEGKATSSGGPTGTQGDAANGLFAGGFTNTRMLTDYGNGSNEGTGGVMGLAEPSKNAAADMNNSIYGWARTNAYDSVRRLPGPRPTTSTHDVYTVGRSGTVWGSGNFQTLVTVSPFGASTMTGATELECTSCHNPHGNAGKNALGQAIPSYRILNYAPDALGFEVTSITGVGTNYSWRTDVIIAPAGFTSTSGVSVPEPATAWYTPNTDYRRDGTLLAYSGTVNGTNIAVAYFAGLGDYGAKYYMYRRPALTVSGAAVTSGTVIGCRTGGTTGVLTVPATACPAATIVSPAFDNVASQDKLGYWCATCHDRYLAKGGGTVATLGTRVTDSLDPGYHYRHRSQGNGTTTGQYTCVSCHNAHGTSATASALSAGATYAGDSALLKADNRAICARCHATSVNFFNVTTSPTTGVNPSIMQRLTYP
jgi:predicted CXXCH cytochrome family protein